ncbi:MAG: tRNA 2-thiouridine(34) synthase MnmA [Patescibacteria group bacterium]
MKIIVGLSGGVDSAVAALLLKSLGYTVKGVFMRNWSEVSPACNWEWDYESAKMVAAYLAIPLELWDFEHEYRTQVFEPAIASFAKGVTPNPDIACNKLIKFGLFLTRARDEGASWIATGHYARIRLHAKKTPYGLSLLTGVDHTKDQSYFLGTLTQDQFHHCLFPLGTLTKLRVRALALQAQLPNALRKDSYGMCFVGEQPFASFLHTQIRALPGPIVTPEGQTLGTHEGLAFYTIGQRKGIRIGGRGPLFVVAKDVTHNALMVTQDPYHPLLFTSSLIMPELHWIEDPPSFPFHCFIRHRHLQPLQEAVVSRGAQKNFMIQFKKPQRAVTPGQFLAIYWTDRETCLGGGTIVELSHVNVVS